MSETLNRLSGEPWLPAVTGALLLLAVGLVLAWALERRARQREAARVAEATRAAAREAQAQAQRAAAELADLREQLARIERVVQGTPGGYRITDLGERAEPGGAPSAPATRVPVEGAPVDRALFADLVVREGAVRTVALAHGVRRALAPATRNRIRFAMRQEVKAARRRRLRETRDLARRARAEERAAATTRLPDGDAA